ncbi:MAG TPA: molybdopterin converting factor subunit 1 [Roseococcus sp.]|jgi:molybdopterin converting factor subunit 1|nr:molybdopterin converting factor subunit 1 [Roseococcus sp.]
MQILYFAWLREKIGAGAEEIALPEGVSDVAALVEHLAARSPGHAAAFANRASIRAAVNQDFATLSTPVAAGDEVAFFPPVTGG